MTLAMKDGKSWRLELRDSSGKFQILCRRKSEQVVVRRGKGKGMCHTSTALYFYGASKKSLHKPRAAFGNILFKISYGFN
jgi:hypothetical protein